MGILEYRTMRLGVRGAHMGFAWGAHEPGVTGCDMGCRTLEFYVNSGGGHWVSWGGTWSPSDKSKVTSDQVTK